MVGFVRAITEINAQALQHNLSILRERAKSSRMLVILKANAYGHGLVRVAQILQDSADGFGVACLGEALQLRAAGIHNKVVVLEGAFSKEDYKVAARLDLDMVIHDDYQYRWLIQYTEIKPIHIWLKVNTGMNRLGISPRKVPSLIKQLESLATVKSIVIMSHLAHADQLAHPATQRQHGVFKRLIQATKTSKLRYSLANSAGILAWPDMHYDWVRPGLALYGLSPFKEQIASKEGLRPVMTLKAKIIAIQKLRTGDCVGYYGRFECEGPIRVGTVSLGYGDGYPYNAPCGTPVLLKNQRVPLIGQVSMDMLAVDLSHLSNIEIGDEVTLWGEGLPLEKIAYHTKRSFYELLCGIQRGTHSRLHVQVI